MPNRLAEETSPYLLQHKDNPVDWYAWGDEAFARARAEDKPVLLSVGYSACHWCHVMAHESFENEAIAAQMNEGFVNIKVDREERPDVDAIYMQAVQALTGRGGWPMTVFLTPEGVPFFGGTYYPPAERGGMPGFPRVLSAVSDAYKNKRSDVDNAATRLRSHLAAGADLRPGDGALALQILDKACRDILEAHDPDFGGFGRAPKFPQPMTLDFLLRYHKRTRAPATLEAAEKTLRMMANGGMYDQVGGGFHRYSTDAVWLVPHFEKMLYDNALLARIYLDAWKVTKDAHYRRITEETLDYVLREMTDPDGGFYSAQDADSEGEEGKFFLWTPAQLEEVLGAADAALVGPFWGVSAGGNFEGSNILHVQQEPAAYAERTGLDLGALQAAIERAKPKLYAAREQRIHPSRDDKVLTSWNGLMLRALAEAALALDSASYREAAVRNAGFLLREMRPDGRLLRTWKRTPPSAPQEGSGEHPQLQSKARINGYLEDYALLIDGLLAVYQATFDSKYLRSAVQLADEMLDLFWDEGVQGFYDTGRDAEALITRPRDLFDNATPSGTSAAADVLLKLALLTDNASYEERAIACLKALAPYVERAPTAFGRLLAALDFHLSQPLELALVWKEDASETLPLLDVVREAYLPNLLMAGGVFGEPDNATPLLDDREAIGGRATAYLCERYVCQLPVTDPSALQEQIAAISS